MNRRITMAVMIAAALVVALIMPTYASAATTYYSSSGSSGYQYPGSNYYSSGSKSTSGAIVFYSKNKPESKRLATCIQQAIKDVAPFRGQSVLEGDYYVLNAANLPAVIVEVGFISSPAEKELLLTPSHRGRLAEAIFRGLLSFFEGS
jgi:N-acetylmuramoyl-L-alanine amidase